jgi:hypothetical protein
MLIKIKTQAMDKGKKKGRKEGRSYWKIEAVQKDRLKIVMEEN